MSRSNLEIIKKALLPTVLLGVLFFCHNASASVSDWQKGFSIQPQSTTDFASSSFQQSLRNLKATGANYVTLIIPYYQANTSATDLYSGSNTPSDASLAAAITYAHSLGMSVNINLHLESADNTWRAYINPIDRNAWFDHYQQVLNHYANIAQENNAEMMTLGAEMIDMTSDNLNATNTSNWLNLIQTVRGIYTGKLTYDGNWGGGSSWNDELDHIKFWSALDYIGVSAYYHIGGSAINSYTSDSLLSAWNNTRIGQIEPLHQQYGKPVLFTEVGYRSVDGNLTHPASWTMTGAVDMTEQADGYQSLFAYWKNIPYFAGVQFWDWSSNPSAGGSADSDFTPQGKSAQTAITSWFTNNSPPVPPPSPTPAPVPTPDVTTKYLSDLVWDSATNGWGPIEKDTSNGEQATGDGHRLTINGKTYDKGLGVHAFSKVTYTINNCTTFNADIGVDDEIVAKGSVVFQVFSGDNKLYDSGLLTYSSAVKTISVGISGVTKLSLVVTDGGNGIAKDHADWAEAKIICQSETPAPSPTPTPDPTPTPTPTPPPPTNAVIDLWWPADGSTVSGTQPFKALLEGYDLNQYQMYWQVDGGQLNLMSNNETDWPHKQADVDVSGWNWQGDGQYALTFTAKDLSENILATKPSRIYISH